MISIYDFSKPPLDITQGEEKSAKRIERFIKDGNLRISVERAEEIEKKVLKKIKAYKDQIRPLMGRLVRWENLISGIIEESNFPFEGASNVTLRYAAGLSRVFKSQFNKTMYSDEDLWYPVFEPGSQEEMNLDPNMVPIIAEAFNHSFSRKANGVETLKEGAIPAFRDGTYILQGEWERKVELVNDERTYRSVQEFQKDYPTPDAAGLTGPDYQTILNNFIVEDDAEIICRYRYKAVLKDKPSYSSILRAKFINYPTFAKKIEDLELYGCFDEVSKEEMKSRASKGIYYKKGVEKAVSKSNPNDLSSWDRARLFVEGRAYPKKEDAPIQIANLVVKLDMDDDGVVEKYLMTFALEENKCILLSAKPYDLKRSMDRVVAFRISARDNAFDGNSMIGDGEDIFNYIDDLFRHDMNVMMLTTSPIFIAEQSLKDTIDLGRAENVIRPGVTYWVPNIEKMPLRQLPVQDISAASGDNNVKLAILQRFLELLVGVGQMESGANTPDDPRAPARKTTLLLFQSNKRVDDNMDEWRSSFEDLARLHGTLMAQFSDGKTYVFTGKDGNKYEVPLSIFSDDRIHWIPKRRSITLTPEFAMARLQSLQQSYAAFRPLLMQGDKVAIELWNRTVQNSGEPQVEKFLIDGENSPQMMDNALKMALRNAELKSNIEARAAGKKKLAQESAKMAVKTIDEASRLQASGAASTVGFSPNGNQTPIE